MVVLTTRLAGQLTANLTYTDTIKVSVRAVFLTKWILSVVLVSPSAALHGRGRPTKAGLCRAKMTMLIVLLIRIVLGVIVLVRANYALHPSTLPIPVATITLRAY